MKTKRTQNVVNESCISETLFSRSPLGDKFDKTRFNDESLDSIDKGYEFLSGRQQKYAPSKRRYLLIVVCKKRAPMNSLIEFDTSRRKHSLQLQRLRSRRSV